MRHRSVQRRLSRYLDGELQGSPRQRVEAHLARCPDCGRVFRTLTVLVGRLHVLRGGPDGRVADLVIRRLSRDAD